MSSMTQKGTGLPFNPVVIVVENGSLLPATFQASQGCLNVSAKCEHKISISFEIFKDHRRGYWVPFLFFFHEVAAQFVYF